MIAVMLNLLWMAVLNVIVIKKEHYSLELAFVFMDITIQVMKNAYNVIILG